jgi:putative transposase
MSEHRSVWSIERMCHVFGVSRSGFYAWQKRSPSRRAVETAVLDAAVSRIFWKHKRRYGCVKIAKELNDEGMPVGKNRVSRRMKHMGLRSKVTRRHRPTTDSSHNLPVAPNLLNRQFSVPTPDSVYVSDITYIASRTGWLYLCVVIDLFSRMVVGWAVSRSLHRQLVIDALQAAIWRRKPGKGLIFHSDRGCQYASHEFRELLKTHGFIQSMSRKGDCWDNAVAESWFRSLKTELVYDESYQGFEDAHRSLFEHIEIYYNRERRHATLGHVSPAQFERTKPRLVA